MTLALQIISSDIINGNHISHFEIPLFSWVKYILLNTRHMLKLLFYADLASREAGEAQTVMYEGESVIRSQMEVTEL